MSTLLVDGDNLLTIGFHGMKNYFHKGTHIGGIFYFINTVRRLFENHKIDKVVVFWDGIDSSHQRELIYPEYKQNRKKNKEKTVEEINSFQFQKTRVQLYLEELYVRQGEYEYCESDDCMAYYCHNSDEDIILVSSDGDMTQMVNDKIKLYHPIHQTLYSKNDKIKFKNFVLSIENIILLKILCGDDSDNITGLKNIGFKRILNFFPEMEEKPITFDYVIERSKVLNEEKKNWVLENIINGISKTSIHGDEFYNLNKKLILLNEPLLTEESKDEINSIIFDNIDSEGRSYKNAMRLMMEDGIHLVLPKTNMAWVNFLTPFLRLTTKEKNKKTSRTFKIKNNE